MKHQYNNGLKNIFAEECPPGFIPGWIKKSEEEYKKIVEKRRKTCLDKHGTETFNNPEKNKETCLTKYGSTTWIHSEEGQKQIEDILIEKYGVDKIFKDPSKMKQSIKTTALNLGYSDEEADKFINVSQIPEINQKTKQTCLKKYGNISYLGTEECKEKTKILAKERYGVEYFSQAQEVSQKVQETCLEKYGVPYFCMTEKCRKSSNNDSNPNKYFAKLLEENNIQYEREFRVNNFSYDFKIGNKLIEINPTSTHNTTFNPFPHHKIDKEYHLSKTNTAVENGYQCIHIWDWDNLNAIIELLKPRETLYARECEIKEVSNEEAKEFLETYHIQGFIKSKIRLGLYHNSQLVSLMTFGKPRYNKNYEYELIRYCSNSNVIGGVEKLFKHFITQFSSKSIISYCDYSKFSGEIYSKLGFTLVRKGKPGLHWVNIKTGQHITNNLLLQKGYDKLFGTAYGKGSSNEELMLQNNFVKVYDCGQFTYTYENNNYSE